MVQDGICLLLFICFVWFFSRIVHFFSFAIFLRSYGVVVFGVFAIAFRRYSQFPRTLTAFRQIHSFRCSNTQPGERQIVMWKKKTRKQHTIVALITSLRQWKWKSLFVHCTVYLMCAYLFWVFFSGFSRWTCTTR